jgi:hypothetical protein
MNSSTDLEYYRRVDFDRIKQYGYEQHGYVPILSLAKWRSMVGDLVKSETNIVEDTHQQMDDVILIEDAKRYIAKLKSLGVSHIKINCRPNCYNVEFIGVSEHEVPYNQRDYDIKYEVYAKAIIDDNSIKWSEYVAKVNEKKLMLSLMDKYPELAKSRYCK